MSKSEHYTPRGRFGDGYDVVPQLEKIPHICHECGGFIEDKDFIILVSQSLSGPVHWYYFPLHESCRASFQLLVMRNREDTMELYGEPR